MLIRRTFLRLKVIKYLHLQSGSIKNKLGAMKKAEAWKITSNLLVYCREFTIHMETNVFTEENHEKMFLGTDD